MNKLLEHFIDITGVPISKLVLNDSGKLAFQEGYPATIPHLKEMAELCPYEKLEPEKRAAILPGDQPAIYGCLKTGETAYLIIGPVFEFPLDNQSARELLEALNAPQTDLKKVIEYHNSVPRVSPHRFAQIILYVNELFDENTTLSIRDLLPENYSHITTDNHERADSAQNAEGRGFLRRKSQAYDAEVFSYLYSGQYQNMKKFLDKSAFSGDTETYSAEALQNYKYLVVSSIAVASRTAAQGGVSYHTAMQLADEYIVMVDKARNLKELYTIHRKMLLSFTELVSECKLGKPASSVYYVVQNYVAEHLTEKITTSDIAEVLKVNRTYLSKQFKEDTGMNLSDYINLQRIQEAKRLLIMSNLTLIEIANRLCFSSQSYFTEIFKGIVGCTPKEYRDSRLPGVNT